MTLQFLQLFHNKKYTKHILLAVYNNMVWLALGLCTLLTTETLYVITEEILSSPVAHWFSPDGTTLCYARIDDSNVPIYKFPTYGPGSQIYDNIKAIKYPKVNGKCSSVKLVFFKLRNCQTKKSKQMYPDSNCGWVLT